MMPFVPFSFKTRSENHYTGVASGFPRQMARGVFSNRAACLARNLISVLGTHGALETADGNPGKHLNNKE